MNKLWVFQSKRYFNNVETTEIKKTVKEFLKNWLSHGSFLDAEIEIIENRFIKIIVHQKKVFASGCAIDAMIKIIKQIDDRYYQLELLNRTLISYKKDCQIITISISELKQKIKNKDLNKEDLIYNLSVNSQKEYDQKFIQKIGESWMKRFI